MCVCVCVCVCVHVTHNKVLGFCFVLLFQSNFLYGADFTVADACLWAAIRGQSFSLPSNIKVMDKSQACLCFVWLIVCLFGCVCDEGGNQRA